MANKSTIFQEIQRECEKLQQRGIDKCKALYLIGEDYLKDYWTGIGGKAKDLPVGIYCLMRASEMENCDAMKFLAYLYEVGRDIPQNMDRAIEFYKMAADAGDVEAMKKLGKLYTCGKIDAEKGGIKPDGAKAVAWYEKAVSHGDNYAMEALGDLYKEGRVVKKSLVKAAEWYQKILDTVTWYPMKRSIMEKLVQMYEKAKSPKKATQWRETLEEAERKYHEEGLTMSKGNGDYETFEYHLAHYKEAAEANDRIGIKINEDGFFHGANTKRAFQWLQQLYETRSQENADVKHELFLLGKMYRYGRGTKKDLQKALDFLMKSSDLGNSWAMMLLGDMYAKGIGVEQDGEQAVAWMKKATATGNSYAMRKLGRMYAEGTGVEMDGNQAVEWYKKSVEAGDADAMQELADMYEEGIAVPQDLVTAVAWRRRSAEAGNESDMDKLIEMYEEARDDVQAEYWRQKKNTLED